MLDVFNRRCLRNILGISRKDHVINADLLHRTGMMNLQNIVADRRRFIGHNTTTTTVQAGKHGIEVDPRRRKQT